MTRLSASLTLSSANGVRGRSLYSRPARLTRLTGARSSRSTPQVWADRTRVVAETADSVCVTVREWGVEVG